MSRRRLGPSEFEGRGPGRLGVFGLTKRTWEKLRAIYRTGKAADIEGVVDPDEDPGRFAFTDGDDGEE